MTKQCNTERCIYCDRLVPFEDDVPELTDLAEWQRRGSFHDEECEWIATRAHQIFEPSETPS
jgi:hypothetical protein